MVYDLALRTFHAWFSFLFLSAFALAKAFDDETEWFYWHMVLGLTLLSLILFRLISGFHRRSHGGILSWPLSIKSLFKYIKDLSKKDSRRWEGHNPASSWGALSMMTLGLCLGATGILMASFDKEPFEDIHEWFANGFMVLVLVHISGLIFHHFKHRDWVFLSMVHGQKQGFSGEKSRPTSVFVAILISVLVGTSIWYLGEQLRAGKKQIKYFGIDLDLTGVMAEDDEASLGMRN